jgi:amphi-Trp domain-containing protein
MIMADSRRFEHESYEDTETIKRYFQSIIDGIENGTITLTDGEEELELKVEGLLKFKIKAKRKAPEANWNLLCHGATEIQKIECRSTRISR